jgi:sugar phosphate isomerase/epimerase
MKLRAVSNNRHTSGVWTTLTWIWELFPELATRREYELHLRKAESCFQHSPHVGSMNCTYVNLRAVYRTRHTSGVWTALAWSWELFAELATRLEYELHLREVEICLQNSPHVWSMNCTYVKLRAVCRTRHMSGVWTALTWSWELFAELATRLEYELHLREVEICFQNSPHVESMNCTYVKLRAVSRTRHISSKYPLSLGTVVTNGGSCAVRKSTLTLKANPYNAHTMSSDVHNRNFKNIYSYSQ